MVISRYEQISPGCQCTRNMKGIESIDTMFFMHLSADDDFTINHNNRTC